MKSFSKIVLAAYLLILLWLVLFKFSFDIPSVLLDHQMRSLNFIPFAGIALDTLKETMYNFIVFIPFGLLLHVNLKQNSFWRKLTFVLVFSFVVEIIQYTLAIGVSDITDVITNTLGGCIGLALYSFGKKHINTGKLDRAIVIICAILLVVFILLRLFVFQVRY